MDMRNGKKTCVRKMTSMEILLGLIIPFILFWGGILTPVVTDSLLVWIFCLVPFYGFVVASVFLFSKERMANLFLLASLLALLSTFVSALMLFVISENFELTRNVCRLAFLNLFPSAFLVFFASANSLVEGCKGAWFHPGFW